MSDRSKFTLATAFIFTALSILGVYKMKSDSLTVRRLGIIRDDLKRAQRESNVRELENQLELKRQLELEQNRDLNPKLDFKMKTQIKGCLFQYSILDANFPMDDSGAPYHLQTTSVANRILTVGDYERARKIANLLDSVSSQIESTRGFNTITGLYKGVSVSIIAIGMGFPMMDMMVREVRAVTKGPLKIIRFGSCGSINEDLPVGSIAIADSACFVSRNPDYFHSGSGEPFNISKSVSSSKDLTTRLFKEISNLLNVKVIFGLNATCDSFYSSQGRIDPNFKDENEGMIQKIKDKHPNAISLEMETFQLYSLSRVAIEPIEVSGCTMVYASRLGQDFISPEKIDYFVTQVGGCILNALIA